MPRFKLISFDTCPYVERSRIVLHEKDQPFEEDFVDLDDKPQWFLDLSPRGKVPVLVVDERPIFESSVINELLDELVAHPPMMPTDPIERAEARSWIAFNDQVLMSGLGQFWFAGDDTDRQRSARQKIKDAFQRLDDRLRDRRQGPYFMGPKFGLIDASIAPVFNRWKAMKVLGEADLMAPFEALQQYGQSLLERSSVRRARAEEVTQKTVEMVQTQR